MELRHNFTVPLDVESTWAHFGDIAALAECFPGAVVTDVEGDTFRGTVKVKLGPIALQYAGSGTFVEKDDAAHRFVVEAKGKDKRGNGTAGATVTLAMTGAGESTEVQVDTDLAITGKPAQFGRGVMQDVSDKLLGQFVSCLEQRLEAPGAVDGAASSVEPGDEPPSSSPAATDQAPPTSSSAPHQAPRSAPLAASHTAPRPAPTQAGDDSLDLGATVLPVLLRTYGPRLAAVLGLVALLVVVRRVLR